MGSIGSREKVYAPPPLSSLTRDEWLMWKRCFLKLIHHKYIPPYKQPKKFFQYTGLLGEEIANSLYFENSKDESNLRTLLFKFDVYFIYGGLIKHCDQNIDDYIFTLKNMAEEAENFSPTTKRTGEETEITTKITDIVKEKVLQDFKSCNVFQKLKTIPDTLYISSYENLALHELIFLWKECERPPEIQKYLSNLEEKQIAFKYITNDSCKNCGRFHDDLKCHAKDQMCWNCDEYDHFARRCSKPRINNCFYCGANHAQSLCPSFAMECSKCKELNHFSWKCPWKMCNPCTHCGRSHIDNAQICPANNNTCSNCYQIGHFTSLCTETSRYGR